MIGKIENYILIIDDDQELCWLLAESVKKENITADVRFNGAVGIMAMENVDY